MNTVSLRKTAITFLIPLVTTLCVQKMFAQNCDPNTPFYSCNLSGNPNGTWTSPSAPRVGLCCSAISPNVCVEILVTLDSVATGMSFNIASGAVPPGALFYQIDCGTPTPVGQPICLDGPGPYHLTFCKPGNNPNSYSINSFGPPSISAQVSNVASPNCSATLSVVGTLYSLPSLTWSSVPPNALYNSFLSCTSGCSTVTVMPSGNLPPYVDYRVCGAGSDPCSIAYVCDTVRVYFFNALNVSVTPGMTLCGGVTTTQISSTVTGGSGAYQYLWSNGQTTSSITAGAGTYTVTVSDTAICSTKQASTTITVVPPIVSMAGFDVTVCENQPSVSLMGNIQTASSAMWTGGAGTFTPNNTSLNATYTPTAFEIANGYVQLVLQTTSNMGCPAATDTVMVTIANVPTATITGNTNACANGPNFFTAPNETGSVYSWTVVGGIINGPSNTNSLSVNWGPSSSGTVSLTMTNNVGCSASSNTVINISQPVIANAGNDMVICQNQNAIPLNGTYQNGSGFLWTGGNGIFNPSNTILNPAYTPSAAEVLNGSAQLILQVGSNAGCPGANDTILLTLGEIPTPVISGGVNVCSSMPAVYSTAFVAGANYSWTVNGGIINGASNTNTINVSWGSGTTGTITLLMTNSAGCTASANKTVNIYQPLYSSTGNDLSICQSQSSIQLNGSVQNATSFMWTGGSGIYNPGNAVLNPIYTPSPSEIANGYAQLILQTSANAGCPSASDTIIINISTVPVASISGGNNICASAPLTYTAPFNAGTNYTWNVSGGTINGPSNSNVINISWGTGSSGTINLTMTNAAGCSASANSNVTVSQPILTAAGNDIMICAAQGSVQLNGSVQNASGFLWAGGSGVFSPGNTNLNTTYTPSVSEITNGSVQLILQTYANQGCPAVNDTILISIAPMPNATLTGSTNICASAPLTYTAPFEPATVYTWIVSGGVINGPTNTNSINVGWGSGNSGTINLTMTNAAGCTSSANATVNVSQPILAVAGNDMMICSAQGSVQLNGSVQNANGFTWTGGNGVFSPVSTVLNPMYTPSASEIANGSAQLILLTYANQGCPAVNDTIMVTIAPMPNATLSGSTNICASAPIIYSAPNEAGTTYTWNVSGGTINGPTNSNSINISWGQFNSGTINLTMTNAAGCTSTANATITISQPIQSVAGNDIMICETQTSIQLNGMVQNASGFMWTGGNGVFSPGNTVLNPTYSPSASEITNGSAMLILQAAANQACPAESDTILVTISAMPDATLSGNVNICADSPVIYSAPNEPGTMYTWNISGGIINGATNSNTVNVSWGTGSSGTLDLTMTNAAGCTSASNVLVSISQPITSNAGSDISICESETEISLDGNIQNTTGYLWQGGSGVFNPGNNVLNPTYSPSATEITNGFVNLVLQTTANQACAAVNDTLHITIFQDPDPVVAGNTVSCTNGTTDYSTTLGVGYSYNWSVTGGTINGSSNSNSINTTWGSSGPCSVSLTITNAEGCSAMTSQNISLVVPPNPVINGNNGPCQFSSSSYSVNSSQGSTYLWTVLNGTIAGGSSSNSININWLNPGSGTVTVTETNSFGCTASDSFQTNISELSIPFITGSNDVCTGPSSVTYTTLDISNTTYAWTVNGGTILSGNGSNSIQVQWNTAGSNSIMLTAMNSSGCDSTIMFAVNVTTVNPPSVLSSGLKGCPPLKVTFEGNNAAPGQSYQWSFGDQENSIDVNPTHTYNTPGTYQVAVSTENGPGCEASSTATVEVFQEPDASFNHNFEEEAYYIGESELDITNTTILGVRHYWTFGDSEPIQTFEPEKVFTEPGDFLITLISLSANGCPDTAAKMIHVRNHEHMYLPNAFTPNGDGTNDYFSMLYFNITDITINIFNRWGRNFFTSHDPDFKWDGTYAGNFVENGVYVYRLEAKGESGKTYVQIGTVTVVR